MYQKRMDSTKKIIRFSHHYSKLDEKLFSTIRRYDKYSIYDSFLVTSRGLVFEALLINKIKIMLKNIPTAFLLYDTDAKTRKEAIKILNSFYQKKIKNDEYLTILFLLRVN